jgi:hypothetical protein
MIKYLCFHYKGRLKGLSLELFIGKPEYYKTIEQSLSANIFIYNHSNHYSETEGIVISDGFETNIALSKKISETYPKPYSECEIKKNVKLTTSADYHIFDLFDKSPYSYRSSDCRTFCYQEILLDDCNCIDNFTIFFNVKNIKIPRLCDWSNSTDIDCYDKVFIKSDLSSVCTKSCPYECDQVKLSMSTSFSALSPDSQTIRVNIYFTDMSYEFSTENPAISVVALFSGLGGTLGKICVSFYDRFRI